MVDRNFANLTYLVECYPVNPYTGLTEALYLSNRPFYMDDRQYDVRLTTAFEFRRNAWNGYDELLGGIIDTDYGQVVVDNSGGRFDYLAGYAWRERKVVILWGQSGIDRSLYTVLFEGKIQSSPQFTDTEMIISIQDRKSDLGDDVQQSRYEGTGTGVPGSISGTEQLADTILPTCLGQVSRAPVLLIEPSIAIYQFHDRGPVMAVDAVYDGENQLASAGSVTVGNIIDPLFSVANGSYVYNLDNGLIRVGATPDNDLVADVRGGKYQLTVTPPVDQTNSGEFDPDPGVVSGALVYAETPEQQVRAVLQHYGVSPVAVDAASFEGLASLGVKTGAFLLDPVTRRDIISQLIGPFGYWLGFGQDGLASIHQLRMPEDFEPDFELDHNLIIDTPVLEAIEEPWLSINVNYGNNEQYAVGIRTTGLPSIKNETQLTKSPWAETDVVVTIVSPIHGANYATGGSVNFTASASYLGSDVTSSIVWRIGSLPEAPGAVVNVLASTLGPGVHQVQAIAYYTPVGGLGIEPRPIYGQSVVVISVDGGLISPAPTLLDSNVWRESIPVTIDSRCYDRESAQRVADFWLRAHNRVRCRVRFTVRWAGFDINMGDVVRVLYPRYGMEQGKNLTVVEIAAASDNDSITVVGWG